MPQFGRIVAWLLSHGGRPADSIWMRPLHTDNVPSTTLEFHADADHAQDPVYKTEPVSLTARIATLTIVILPIAGLIAAIILLWGVGFSWVHLGLLLGMYLVTTVGITVGFHRLFTHKSFETVWPIRMALAIAGSLAIEGSLFKWVAMHRLHHQHSDEHDDPHSPHTHGGGVWAAIHGFYRSHVGWFFEPDPVNLDRYIPDLTRDRLIKAISNLFPLWIVVSLGLPALLGGLITLSWLGVLLGFIWGGLVRVLFVHHITWSINSICHIWGTQPFRSHDHSRNNLIFGILAFGEGWHNNHHAFPTSARHGLRWWQIDFAYMLIRGMELVGLAKRVRVPSQKAMDAKRAR
jgi:stearoyl-CoA desaturase (Delta-9 desaturase)